MPNAKIIFFVIGFIFLILNGCATIPKEADIKKSLNEISIDYWKARMADEYDKTYSMEYPEGRLKYNDYVIKAMAIKRMNIQSHTIKDVHIEGDKGLVDVEFTFIIPPITKPFKQTIKDSWVYKDGQWFHILPE